MRHLAIFDYGAGNLHSLAKALAGDDVRITVESDVMRAARADMLVLPGVGAFGAATARLGQARSFVRDAVRDGLPTIGICLGMQLLFDASDEGEGAGLGVLAGRVTRLRARRVPHIGWNELASPVEGNAGGSPMAELPLAYFANSYACRPEDESMVTAWARHEGDQFAAIVERHRAVGVQFHPEKSSMAGVRFLRRVVDRLCTMENGE